MKKNETTYRYSREEIVEIIKKCDKTKDGFYWCPKFRILNIDEGDKKDDYYYNRELFRFKLYFSDDEINLYLSKDRLDYNFLDFYRKSTRFYETNKNIVSLNINDYIAKKKFKVGELIDCFEFIINNYQY